jgi:hypothetical protein
MRTGNQRHTPASLPSWKRPGSDCRGDKERGPQPVYLFTYLLTIPWSRVLEKLTDSQLVKKFPAFYGTRMFITVFTSVRHLSLSWASSIQSMPPQPISWRSIIILSSNLRLGLPNVRVQVKCDGTRWHTGGEVKRKLANGVGSQYSSHYLGTRCIQHYYRWCVHLGCQ